jgi:hypothetical protein
MSIFLGFIFNHGKKIGFMMIVLIALMIGGYLYISYIVEPKETIAKLERENTKLLRDLRMCENNTTLKVNECITEYEYEELNRSIQTIKEEKNNEVKIINSVDGDIFRVDY